MRTNKGAIDRYTEFIKLYNNQCVSLSMLLKDNRMNHVTLGWNETGVAIPVAGHGMYRIVSNNPRKDAIRILRANQKRQLDNNAIRINKTIIQPELSIPERKPAIIQMERIDKAKKKISILWGMIKIEQ